MTQTQFFDEHTLYVNSGVGREDQLTSSLNQALENAEKELKRTIPCKFKINLLINKDGDYFGFGYLRVSNPEVYWMILGKNSDGTERVVESKDPYWIPPLPLPPGEEIDLYQTNMSWGDIVMEEEKHKHPIIREELDSLMVLPGYEYDDNQYEHLKQTAVEEGKVSESVPKIGYFEISRAFSKNAKEGRTSNKLCARNVPNWIPDSVFKNIFILYATDPTKKVRVNNCKNDDTYPVISSVETKKQGRMLFVMYDPSEHDGLFALLMTRKVRIQHPNNRDLKCTLIFDHAYDNSNGGNNNNNRNRKNKDPRGKDDYITRREKRFQEKKETPGVKKEWKKYNPTSFTNSRDDI